MQCFKPLPINLGPLVQRTTSPNTRLNLNPGFFIPLCKSSFGIIYFTPLRASTSNHQIVNKKSYTEFSFNALRTEIRFHPKLGLS